MLLRPNRTLLPHHQRGAVVNLHASSAQGHYFLIGKTKVSLSTPRCLRTAPAPKQFLKRKSGVGFSYSHQAEANLHRDRQKQAMLSAKTKQAHGQGVHQEAAAKHPALCSTCHASRPCTHKPVRPASAPWLSLGYPSYQKGANTSIESKPEAGVVYAQQGFRV